MPGGTTTTYYYITNLQGDVLGMITGDGQSVASYAYDPYGKVLSATGTMASINPLRYRGYYYDTETGFYYLQSRYYDPTICRFINADRYISTGQGILGNNMFAYCLNAPVGMIDFEGTDAIYVSKTTGGESLIIVGHAILFFQDANGKWWKTQFIGKTPASARVMLREADMEFVNKMLAGEKIEGTRYTYIKGDFSNCYAAAEKYENTNYGGYELVSNNCLHYVKEILFEGTFDDRVWYFYARSSSTIIPKDFHWVFVQAILAEQVYL